MNSWLRRLLTDKRKFRLAIGLLAAFFVLGAGLIVGLMILAQKIGQGAIQGSLASKGNEEQLVLSDEANVPFMPHVDLLNSLAGELISPVVRKARLDTLSHLPGAIGAVCLVDGKTLETVPENMSLDWLMDSLRVLRRGPASVRDDIIRHMVARALFRTYSHGSDTLYIVADTYDANGQRIVRKKSGKKYKPEESIYLFAVVMDPHWIRKAVSDHMSQTIFAKDALFLHTTYPEREGMGVLAGQNVPWAPPGDTIWWWGARSLSGKNRFEYKTDWDYTSNLWFRYRTVYELPDKQLDASPETPWVYKVVHGTAPIWMRLSPYAISLLLLLSGGIFLASLSQMRKQWLSRQVALEHLSHSIKTPIARLRLNSDTLLESRVVSPEVERDVVQAIGRECNRLERAVQNAALAIQEGGLIPHLTAFDLRDLLSELRDTWNAAFTQQHVTLNLNAESNGQGMYDRDLLAVLFDNLLDNALRHSRLNRAVVENGQARVMIRLTQSAEAVFVKICDSGTGIHPKDLKRIFARFERGRERALTGASGLGLGLALSKEIAEVHGGTIIAENPPEGGACFTVTLPRKAST